MSRSKNDKDFRIVIQDQHILSRDSLSIAAQSSTESFSGILFIDCHFDKVDVSYAVFVSCRFQNCVFQGCDLWKCTISSCRFDDSKIIDSDMSKLDCDDTQYKNCEFINVKLVFSFLSKCKVNGTRFLKSNLNTIITHHCRIEDCTIIDCDIENPLFFGTYIKNMNYRLPK